MGTHFHAHTCDTSFSHAKETKDQEINPNLKHGREGGSRGKEYRGKEARKKRNNRKIDGKG